MKIIGVMDASGNPLTLMAGLVEATVQSVAVLLPPEATEAAFGRAAEILLTQTDRLLADIERRRSPEIACRKGCFWCCHAYISATALETLALARFIQDLPLDQQAATKARVAEAARIREGLTWTQQEDLRLLCPLLVDGACSVYPARPLACRCFVARSAEPCRHNFEKPDEPRHLVEYYRLFREVGASVRVGMQAGLEQTQRQNADVPLLAALDHALQTPDILERWLAGEQVFPDTMLELA